MDYVFLNLNLRRRNPGVFTHGIFWKISTSRPDASKYQLLHLVPKGNNIVYSLIEAAVQFDFDLSIASPKGYEPNKNILQWAKKNKGNILVTKKSPSLFPGANDYISDNLNANIKKIINDYKSLEKWIIGGPNIIDQLFDLIDTFYITRIYGKFNCDKKLNLTRIQQSMKLENKFDNDETCHFEVWKRWNNILKHFNTALKKV